MQDVWSAFLAAGPRSVVSHETALHLHGVHLVGRRPITLTIPHGRHARLDGVMAHQIDDLKPHRVADLSGLPVTTAERTAVDLAATLGERQLGKAGGLPPPLRQFRLPGRGAIEGLVDAAYPDVCLIVEVDGRRWHTRIADLKRDHQRDTEAARVGWLTLRFLYEQVVHDPSELCRAVADVRSTRTNGTSPRQ